MGGGGRKLLTLSSLRKVQAWTIYLISLLMLGGLLALAFLVLDRLQNTRGPINSAGPVSDKRRIDGIREIRVGNWLSRQLKYDAARLFHYTLSCRCIP